MMCTNCQLLAVQKFTFASYHV